MRRGSRDNITVVVVDVRLSAQQAQLAAQHAAQQVDAAHAHAHVPHAPAAPMPAAAPAGAPPAAQPVIRTCSNGGTPTGNAAGAAGGDHVVPAQDAGGQQGKGGVAAGAESGSPGSARSGTSKPGSPEAKPGSPDARSGGSFLTACLGQSGSSKSGPDLVSSG